MSGHSKWHNIRLKKGKVDAQRGALFSKLSKEIIEEELAIRLTTEDVEKVFNTLVGWARFGELFNYDATSEELSIDTNPSSSSSPHEDIGPVK